MSRTDKKYGGGTKGSGTRARSGGVRRSGTWKRSEFIPELDEKAIQITTGFTQVRGPPYYIVRLTPLTI